MQWVLVVAENSITEPEALVLARGCYLEETERSLVRLYWPVEVAPGVVYLIGPLAGLSRC